MTTEWLLLMPVRSLPRERDVSLMPAWDSVDARMEGDRARANELGASTSEQGVLEVEKELRRVPRLWSILRRWLKELNIEKEPRLVLGKNRVN